MLSLKLLNSCSNLLMKFMPTMVDRFYPSTQTCSVCNVKRVTNLTLKERSWQCDHCGTKHDRDLNAAMNILLEAKRITV